MSADLFRQLRRVEAQAERGFEGTAAEGAERRRRLWDSGLTVGHSVRSLDDCVAMARTDFASRTSMQEARYVVGDRRLFQRFRRVLAEDRHREHLWQVLGAALG